MDFELSEEQKLLAKGVREFFEKECPRDHVREMERDDRGYSIELWRKMVQLGYVGMVFPEEYVPEEFVGGGNFSDLLVFFEEAGKVCMPFPYFSTVVLGGLSLMNLGNEEQKKKFLPAISRGKCLMTLALLEPMGTYEVEKIRCKAEKSKGVFLLSGTKVFVPDAHTADYVIVVAKTMNGNGKEGISTFIIARNSITEITPLFTIARDKQFEVVLDRVRASELLGPLHEAWQGVEQVIQRATIAKCAETLGLLEAVLDMTISYVRQRKQFGRPIGSLQVIQFNCVDMLVAIGALRFLIWQAGKCLEKSSFVRNEVSMAKAMANETSQKVTILAHQLFGSIGLTTDMDLELYTRRLKAFEAFWGNIEFHREIVAQELGL